MRSALASPVASITPCSSTSAACLFSAGPLAFENNGNPARPMTKTVMYANVSNLKKMPQRREVFCSLRAANANCSMALRSQAGSSLIAAAGLALPAADDNGAPTGTAFTGGSVEAGSGRAAPDGSSRRSSFGIWFTHQGKSGHRARARQRESNPSRCRDRRHRHRWRGRTWRHGWRRQSISRRCRKTRPGCQSSSTGTWAHRFR